MKVTLTRINNAVLFEANNENGNRIKIDGTESVGGVGGGFRPMQLLLAGIGSCSAIDVVSFLKKMRQSLTDISVTITGERMEKVYPSVFTAIHLHYTLTGELSRKSVERALELGIRKYCSVAAMLEKTAEISYSYELK